MKLSALIALAALLSGCATKTGRWYPIVGFGWVIVNTNQPSVFTSKTLGLNAGNGQMSVGLSSFTSVAVPTNANVVIDLKQ